MDTENHAITNCLELISDIKLEYEQNCLRNVNAGSIENDPNLKLRKLFWSMSAAERALQRCTDIPSSSRQPNPEFDPRTGYVSEEYLMKREMEHKKLEHNRKVQQQKLMLIDSIFPSEEELHVLKTAVGAPSSSSVGANHTTTSSSSSTSQHRAPTTSVTSSTNKSSSTLSEMILKYQLGKAYEASNSSYTNAEKLFGSDVDARESYHSDPLLAGFRCDDYAFPPIHSLSGFRRWLVAARQQWKAALDKKGKLVPRSTYATALSRSETNAGNHRSINSSSSRKASAPALDPSTVVQGFKSLSKGLARIHPLYLYVTFGGLRNPDHWLANVHKNPCFSYPDTPFPGWRRDFSLRQSGQDPGALDSIYSPPTGTRKLRTKGDITQYLLSNHLPESLINQFETRSVYCVCHQPQLEDRTYLECSYGRGGCHGWLHPECVGLSGMTESEMKAIEVICPLCTFFLDGLPDSEKKFKNKRVLREITYSPPTSFCSVNGKVVLECSDPPEQWGLLRSAVPTLGHYSMAHEDYARSPVAVAPPPPTVANGAKSSTAPTTNTSRARAVPKAQKIRDLNKDVPDEILQHSLFQMMPLDDEEEPMYGSSDYDNVDTSDQQPEPESAEPDVQIPYIPLDISYKRSLVESAIAFARPGNKKKRVRTGMDAVNEAEAAASAGSSGALRLMVEEPVLCFLPLESGSVCVGCVSEGDMLRSVHVPCAFSLLCGYCLSPFDNGKSSTSESDYARQNKKRKSGAAEEEYSLESAAKKVPWELGVVNYDVHRACAFFSRRTEVIEDASADNDNDNDNNSDDPDQEQRTEKTQVPPSGPYLGSDFIQLGHFYSYDEPDDATCDLCGRMGGVLQYFSIDSARSALQPPSADGWLAHVPCIHWLAKSRWLEMPPPESDELNSLRDSLHENEVVENYTQQLPLQQTHKSMFDANFAAWRCVLCSSQEGLTVRCCGIACTVRAHPLCIIQASSPWQLVTGFVQDGSDPNLKAPIFRCKVHSGLDTVCVS